MKTLGLWVSDLLTVFLNGAIKGLPVGGAVGGAAMAATESLDPQTLTVNAALGVLLGMCGNGLKSVVVWHDANPMPNPFRQPPAS